MQLSLEAAECILIACRPHGERICTSSSGRNPKATLKSLQNPGATRAPFGSVETFLELQQSYEVTKIYGDPYVVCLSDEFAGTKCSIWILLTQDFEDPGRSKACYENESERAAYRTSTSVKPWNLNLNSLNSPNSLN